MQPLQSRQSVGRSMPPAVNKTLHGEAVHRNTEKCNDPVGQESNLSSNQRQRCYRYFHLVTDYHRIKSL